MTKKDYVLIAEALKRSRPRDNRESIIVRKYKDRYYHGKIMQYSQMCTNIMSALASENPLFNETKFLTIVNE